MYKYIKRTLDITFPKQSRAVFLWGARKTGKSTYLKQRFPKAFRIDLLSQHAFLKYTKDPHLLYEAYNRKVIQTTPDQPLMIDEIQKVPSLLDEVQRLIEDDHQYIILCGSSARKLKRTHANLLGGRAWKYVLRPFSYLELGSQFELIKALNHGLIPDHYFEKEFERYFEAYIEDYLQQEIQMEGVVRNLPAFYRFFDTIGFTNGELVNFSNIAKDVGTNAKTIRQYFEILSDTYLGILLEPWEKHKKRQIITETPKFYFFDIGLANYLARRLPIREKTFSFGKTFEHFIFMELLSYKTYSQKRWPIRFWRINENIEIDFILGEGDLAIEVKATSQLTNKLKKTLKTIKNETQLKKIFIIYAGKERLNIAEDIYVYPWKDFLNELWKGKII